MAAAALKAKRSMSVILVLSQLSVVDERKSMMADVIGVLDVSMALALAWKTTLCRNQVHQILASSPRWHVTAARHARVPKRAAPGVPENRFARRCRSQEAGVTNLTQTHWA
jgi:hypothetical protein